MWWVVKNYALRVQDATVSLRVEFRFTTSNHHIFHPNLWSYLLHDICSFRICHLFERSSRSHTFSSTMTRKFSVSNPGGGEASRQNWERYTWLSVSKECYKRGYFPATSAYDEKGILRKSACPDLHRHVVRHASITSHNYWF
jgi:hypothetical protein